MKLSDWTAFAVKARRAGISRAAVLLGLLGGGLAIRAQDIVAPRPMDEVVPVALQQAQALNSPVISPAAALQAEAPDTAIFQWGPATGRAHLLYRYLYGDGIPSRPGQHLTTSINSIAPDLLIDLGTHWTVDYIPTWVFYSNRAFNDTFDQSVRLSGWTAYEDWVVRLSQSYASSSFPLIETAQQTKEVTWLTDFNATYSFNSKLALELTARQMLLFAENFTDSRDWSTTDWLHYKLAPKLDAALGLGVGYVQVSQGADMTYTRPQAQVNWGVTDKLTFHIHGGLETRRFHTDGVPDLNTSIYGASVQYQPIETTKLTLDTSRDVGTSFFANQITKTTSWNFQLEQRLLKELLLTAGYSRQQVSYVSSAGSVLAGRDDRSHAVTVRLTTVLFRRSTVALVYQNSQNASNTAGYNVSSRQVGLEIGYRF